MCEGKYYYNACSTLFRASSESRSLLGDLHGFLFGMLYMEHALLAECDHIMQMMEKVAEFLGFKEHKYALSAFA